MRHKTRERQASCPRRAKWIGLISLAIAGSLIGAANGLAGESNPATGEITAFNNLRYREGASKQWVLDLAMPKKLDGKARPAIVVIHGGGWLEGDKSSFTTAEHQTPANIVDFAKLGFVAVTINYRMSGEAPFPAALDDCRSAVRWLRAHAGEYHIDPDHIGAYGNSAGGHLALLLGMMPQPKDAAEQGPSSQVQAVVSDSGPLDLLTQYQQNYLPGVIEKFMGGPPDASRVDDYKRASPINYVSADQKLPPLLLIYGGVDTQVKIQITDDFVAMLGRSGHQDVNYIRLATVDHCPHSLIRIPYLRPVVNEFFARTLKLSKSQATQ